MPDELEPTQRSPAAQATPITPPAAASPTPGSGRVSTSLQSLPSQDLSSDKLILSAAQGNTDAARYLKQLTGGK